MSKVYYKTKDNLAKIILYNILFLLPLICFGLYKNCYLLMAKHVIELDDGLKVLILILIDLFLDIATRVIFKKKLHFDYDILYGIMIPLFMPFNVSIPLYIIFMFACYIGFNYLEKIGLKFNKVVIGIIVMYLVTAIFGGLSFENPLEQQNLYAFNYWDLLIGRNVGPICTTSIVIGLLYVFLNSKFNGYKWIVACSSLGAHSLIMLLLSNFDINVFVSSLAIMPLLLLAPLCEYSPNRWKTQIIFGCLVGVLSAIITKFISGSFGSLTAILLANFLYAIFILRKENKLVGNLE